ncbi:unnamed protein product, partial [Brachionus calyciflorus]
SVTTFDELGSLNNVEHANDTLSNIEYNSLLVEIRIIERAKNEQTSLPKIFDDELANLVSTGVDHELVAAFLNSKRNKIEQKAYRAKALNTEKIQHTDDINLNGEFGLTVDNQPFVLFDSNDTDRIIGFCSPIGLEILSKAKRLHSDGTFKSTPKLYYQTFCIHAWFLEQMFWVLYKLLKEKSERIYRKKLTLLKEASYERGIIINPDTLEEEVIAPTLSTSRGRGRGHGRGSRGVIRGRNLELIPDTREMKIVFPHPHPHPHAHAHPHTHDHPHTHANPQKLQNRCHHYLNGWIGVTDMINNPTSSQHKQIAEDAIENEMKSMSEFMGFPQNKTNSTKKS